MLLMAVEKFDYSYITEERSLQDQQEIISQIMPKIIFATPLKMSDIKKTEKTFRTLDDKNLLDSLIYY